MKTDTSFLPAVSLTFNKGDLIVKQGDYGISVYQIVEGKVGVFIQSNGNETLVETLGPGEIIGEMIFLSGYAGTRSASVRAMEKSVLEAWHPSRIKREYDEMPLIIRKMANQMVSQLIKVDRMISEHSRGAKQNTESTPPATKESPKKREYTKDVLMDCRYRPVEAGGNIRLWGRVKKLSRSGLRIDVMRMNALDYPHEVGNTFACTIYAEGGKKLHLKFQIEDKQLHEKERILSIGAQIVEMDRDSKTKLGFLLLA
jgi:CRP-like cAMP-binding protein